MQLIPLGLALLMFQDPELPERVRQLPDPVQILKAAELHLQPPEPTREIPDRVWERPDLTRQSRISPPVDHGPRRTSNNIASKPGRWPKATDPFGSMAPGY